MSGGFPLAAEANSPPMEAKNLRVQARFHALQAFRFRCSQGSLACKRSRLHRSRSPAKQLSSLTTKCDLAYQSFPALRRT
jgi:hypothetical protein